MSSTQRCYYEVLDVDEKAAPDDIRKAYRKQALVWHPDKNQDRLEEADTRFKEIQNAYDTLSSPHDRAWYDSHKHQILRGEDAEGGGGRPDSDINLWPYFSHKAFAGFAETGKGFYSVYGNLFASLAQQEMTLDPEIEPPDFGGAQASAPEVMGFYSYWLNFTTVKDFAWADEYNPANAPNRKVRRLMEEENKKKRRSEKKQFVDLVRQLAAHVRKKDPRVAVFQADAAAAAEEKEKARAAHKAQKKKEKLKEAMAYEDADWIRNSKEVLSFEEEEELRMAQKLAAEGKSLEDDQPVEDLYCIVCRKRFKNENQWANHEKSKKHLEKVAELKAELQLEEEELRDSLGESDANNDEGSDENLPSGPSELPTRHRGKKKNARKWARQSKKAEGLLAQAMETAPGRSHNVSEDPLQSSRESDEDDASDEDDDGMLAKLLEGHKLRTNLASSSPSKSSNSEGSASDSERREHEDVTLGGAEEKDEVEEVLVEDVCVSVENGSHANQPIKMTESEVGDANRGSDGDELVGDLTKGQPKGKAKERRAKRALAKELKVAKAQDEAPDPLLCQVCGVSWPSRSKLFKHIKQSGHATMKIS